MLRDLPGFVEGFKINMKIGGEGGLKAVWNFPENSFDLAQLSFPKCIKTQRHLSVKRLCFIKFILIEIETLI